MVKGFVSVLGSDGRVLAATANTTVYSGYDLMTRALMGDRDAVVNGVYLQYVRNTSAPAEPSIPLTRDAAYYRGLTGANGFLRLRTLTSPEMGSTDSSKYNANKAVFTAFADSQSESHGASFSIADGSQIIIFSTALAAIPDFSDMSKDVVYSAAALKNGGVYSPLTFSLGTNSNLYFAIKWQLTQEAPQ